MSSDLDEVIAEAEVLVVGKKSQEVLQRLMLIENRMPVIDLVRICDQLSNAPQGYHGICW